eukprot:TRINITY_DN3138_c0_g2_i1.p1 TRINITY_DN3138_c0_g2~~TRINITY_DN3138_c0_g2_i1.p1  ORF type:complete len:259 (+),score=18.37 TRINITY_DN3138_c0_g2_i1:99-875(+)
MVWGWWFYAAFVACAAADASSEDEWCFVSVEAAERGDPMEMVHESKCPSECCTLVDVNLTRCGTTEECRVDSALARTLLVVLLAAALLTVAACAAEVAYAKYNWRRKEELSRHAVHPAVDDAAYPLPVPSAPPEDELDPGPPPPQLRLPEGSAPPYPYTEPPDGDGSRGQGGHRVIIVAPAMDRPPAVSPSWCPDRPDDPLPQRERSSNSSFGSSSSSFRSSSSSFRYTASIRLGGSAASAPGPALPPVVVTRTVGLS